jgi:hypothetical protein
VIWLTLTGFFSTKTYFIKQIRLFDTEAEMKTRFRLLMLLAILVIAFISAGCEKDGEIRVINRTSHNLYAGIFDVMHTIPADSSVTVHVSTQRKSFLDSSVGRYVEVYLEGETYQIWDDFQHSYVDSTFVWVEAGNTTRIFADPNRACVKVINNTERYIKRIIVQRNTNATSNTMTYEFEPPMAPDATWFKQQVPATAQYHYFYLVQVVFENDEIYTYGDTDNILYEDDLFLVDVQDPLKK